jgi:hypothetical protein
MLEWHFADWKWSRVRNYGRLAAYAAQQLRGPSTRLKIEKLE